MNMDTIVQLQAAADVIEDAAFTPEGKLRAISAAERSRCADLARTVVTICDELMNTVEVDLMETCRVLDRAHYVLERLKA